LGKGGIGGVWRFLESHDSIGAPFGPCRGRSWFSLFSLPLAVAGVCLEQVFGEQLVVLVSTLAKRGEMRNEKVHSVTCSSQNVKTHSKKKRFLFKVEW